MSLKSKRSSLADRINSLITTAPDNFGSDDENGETTAKVVERFVESDSEDVGLNSSIRKQNINLLDEVDERYKGKKVLCKDIYGDDSSEDVDESSNEEKSEELAEESSNEDDDFEREDENSEINSEEDDDDSDHQDDSDVDEDNPLRRDRDPGMNFKSMTATNLRGDIEKGSCVREQLKLWEHLLEMRIQLQKCLITSNQLPQHNAHTKFQSDKQFTKTANETKTKLKGLLENLLEVQEKLLKNNSETKNLLSKKNQQHVDEKMEEDPMDEEIPSDTEDEMEQNEETEEQDESSGEKSEEPPKKKRKTLEEYEKILTDRHENFKSCRDSVIQKWNDKTRLASGNATKGTSQSVVKQIEFVLNEKSKVIKRTQLKRSEYNIIGKESLDETDEDGRRVQEYDPEIYDDDDFYHQLLRELIEQKSADITDPIQLSKQWIQLQNMRNKMKRKIDTRATKGRRIRYNVHTKLVNYMAPIIVNDTWTNLAKNELYNSLFGKIKNVEPSKGESNKNS